MDSLERSVSMAGAIYGDRHQPDSAADSARGTDWAWKSAALGLLAGIVMAAVTMAAAVLAGDTIWTPIRTIAALFLGEDRAGDSFDGTTVLIGAGIHMLLSMMFGIIYGFVVGLFSNRAADVSQGLVGLIYGLILWAANTFAVAPLLPGGEIIEDNLVITTIPSWAWATAHLLYGLTLGLAYARSRNNRTTLVR
jgi:hypothetical protein